MLSEEKKIFKNILKRIHSSPLKKVFTQNQKDPFSEVKWTKRNSVITEPDGSVVFETKDVEVPEGWSQLATDILVSKYFRKRGVPKTREEKSLKQVVHRIVRTIRSEGERQGGFFPNREEADTFESELKFLLVNQYGAFNSPVWFNCGLYHEYGIKGSSGNWGWNFEKEKATPVEHVYSRPQSSACFIQSVEDDLMSIFDLAKTEARLFKYGSGTGTNFSSLRGRQELLSGGGTSSGLMSFLEVFDRGAGATKSGGTTRRAAKMVCLDVDHPEIADFIEWKAREEKKAHALIAQGFDSDFNGEAYKTISGQNSNNSVRVSDEFMEAVLENNSWQTKFRTTKETCETFPAKDLMQKIANAAWSCADPGIQFDTTINHWHTCKNSGKINASNPCSEYMFLDNTACNLASLNLIKFYDEEKKRFDVYKFRHACRLFTMAQEILVDLSSYPTDKIAENSHNFRPLGLGYANLGTLLMVMGVPYDSDEGRSICSTLTAIMTGEAYATSAKLAEQSGPFPAFEKNRVSMIDVMKMHRDAAYEIPEEKTPRYLREAALDAWEEAIEKGRNFGYRNAQVTVLAPTGTIGLLMDCDTTGIEPDFSLIKFKKLAGGGAFQIVNQSVAKALHGLGYEKNQIENIVNYIKENGTIEGAPQLQTMDLPIFDCASKGGEKGKRFLAPMAHIKMMAAAQPFLSGAISKTVNLPNEITAEEIEDLYIESWRLGLKSVAVYRDGCKMSQPLNAASNNKTKKENAMTPDASTPQNKQPEKQALQRRRLPKKRQGLTVEARVGGQKVYLRTGEYKDGGLGEIFIDMHKEGAAFRSMMNCFAIAVSLGLQYGVPLEKYVDCFTFTRFEPQGVVDHPNIKMSTSVVDFIFRVLGMEYLGRTDFVQVKPEKDEDVAMAMEPASKPTKKAEMESNGNGRPIDSWISDVQKAAEFKAQATGTDGSSNIVSMEASKKKMMSTSSPHLASEFYARLMKDAPFCDQCGHVTVRNGSCYRCMNCGNSMGCS